VPTVCFNIPGITPAAVTQAAAAAGIAVRDGHMYSPRLMRRLGLAVESGAVRASLVHYNTVEEVKQFGGVLARLPSATRSAPAR
jgi:selenocysteine lyase/cysteine desulfurase